MTGKEYTSLQIGMYVTDQTSLVKSDYCIVQEFDRLGRMKLQPLDEIGQPDGEPYWIHYKDYDLHDKMMKSEFNSSTV